MSYTPKRGDRVTSPSLVGEWEVTEAHWTMELYVSLRQDRVLLPRILAERLDLAPVAPPLPPEPPVGSVVRADGQLWQRDTADATTNWFAAAPPRRRGWSELAAAPDLSPVVAVEDVAEWLDRNTPTATKFGGRLRAEFGGWDK